jgi:hypothetical protein
MMAGSPQVDVIRHLPERTSFPCCAALAQTPKRRHAPRQLRQRDRPPRLVLHSPTTTQQCSLEDRKQGQPGGRLIEGRRKKLTMRREARR